MKQLGYSDGYKYSHDYPDHFIEQQYLPDELKSARFWHPQHNVMEDKQVNWIKRCWGNRFDD
jgi:putative ATPase